MRPTLVSTGCRGPDLLEKLLALLKAPGITRQPLVLGPQPGQVVVQRLLGLCAPTGLVSTPKLTSAHPLERLSLLTAHHGLGCACLCAQAACLAGVRPSWQAWLERTLVERTVMAACIKPGPR